MSKHLNPLEKEFLIRQYKSNTRIKMRDFCETNHISTGAFQKWIKQYDEGGLESFSRRIMYENGNRSRNQQRTLVSMGQML